MGARLAAIKKTVPAATKLTSRSFILVRISFTKKRNREYWLPPQSKEAYLKALQSCKEARTRMGILNALTCIYRADTIKNGWYSITSCDELIDILAANVDYPSLSEATAHVLVREGSFCEGIRDYASALKFYEKSLVFRVDNKDLQYFRLNNLAFCLNYFKRFMEAEAHLREAITIDPSRFNAFKNLGVCLEHQGKYEEAARCFLRSAQLCKSDSRAAKHLIRLLKRHPELKNMPELSDFTDLQGGDLPPTK